MSYIWAKKNWFRKENENIHHSHSIGIVPGHPWLRAKNETTAERKATLCG